MKVTLVYAGISTSGFDCFSNDNYFTKEMNYGLAYISAYAKRDGHIVDLIDLRKLKGYDHFSSVIKKINPKVIGITMISVNYTPVMECLKIIKDINPNMLTVIGGPHPTLCTEELIDNPLIDYIIKGEGEISFSNLLKDIELGKKNERIIQGIHPNLEDLPFPDRDLFCYEEVVKVPMNELQTGLSTPMVSIIAGRGCRYNCSFCQPAERQIFGKHVQRRSVANVIRELNELRRKYNFKSLFIHDDNLTEDPKWVAEFCHEFIKGKFNKEFACQSRADIIINNIELIKLMKDTGLKALIIGFESGNNRVLKFLRKGTTVEMNLEAAEICKKNGIKIIGNFMMGIPTETNDEVMDTVRLIKKIKPSITGISFFTPHPGSDLYTYCIENDLSLIKDHGSYDRNIREPKIKGVDYRFLNQAFYEAHDYSGTQILCKKIIDSKFVFKLRKKAEKNSISLIFIKNTKKILNKWALKGHQ